jgi:transposase
MGTVYSRSVPTRLNSAQKILTQNAELSARLKLAQNIAAERSTQIEALQKQVEQLKAERTHYCERTVLLEEELRWIKSQYFGSLSQKQDAAAVNPDQPMLFNEAEVLTAIAVADEAHQQRATKVEAHERAHTGGRKAIPKHFPRIPIEHDLPEQQKMCTKCPTPHLLVRIGHERRECYRFDPPKISVEEHIRWTYACTHTHEHVITAPNPPTLLPKSMASPSLLAHLVTAKFDDNLPLYRVSRQLERSGMDLSPGTAGTWVNTVGGEKVLPLIKVLNTGMFSACFWHMDESPLQVLKSEKAPSSNHYMVVRAAGPPGKRIILYDYIPSRTKEGLKQLLIDPDGTAYRGKLLTDGLERYDEICAELQLLHFGCLQHARAHFFKARKVSQLPSSRTLANAALEDHIRPIFAVESEIEKLRNEYAQRGETLPPEVVHTLRQEKAKPLLEKFKRWVDELLPGTPPNGALGKALGYAHRQWDKLARYAEHPDVPAHNNFVEQQIKHYATGRKCWYFCYDKVGAQASANLFSLVMTCRANDVARFEYLSYIFEHLPTATTVDALEALLPWNVKPILEECRKHKEAALRSAAAN